MQTICIIIVKRKLNYVKNEEAMTDYDSSLEVKTLANPLLRSTLGERNPNLKLDGLPVLYVPRYFEFFVRGLPFGRPSWFLQGQASFSNLADLVHGRILIGCPWLLYVANS